MPHMAELRKAKQFSLKNLEGTNKPSMILIIWIYKMLKISPGVKAGKLPDGTNINIRTKSSDRRLTLEIYDGKKSTKIRYGD